MRWLPVLLLPSFLACAGIGQQINRIGAEADVSAILGVPSNTVSCAMVGSTRAFTCQVDLPTAGDASGLAATLGASRMDGTTAPDVWAAFKRSGCAITVSDDAYRLWYAPRAGNGFGGWFVLEQAGDRRACVASEYLFG